MKMNALKLIKKISLVLLVSGLTMSVANAQSRTNKRVITKTVKTKKTPTVKKVATTKIIKSTPTRVNKRQVVTRKAVNRRYTKLPSKSRYITHNKIKYAYNNGVFYKPQGNTYIKVNRPSGLRISVVL